MSVRNTTFEYKEHEMEVEGAYNDVMVAVNENKEIEIVECQDTCLNSFHYLKFHQKY